MELLFERFLSESRGEWPDIDLDLPSEEKREQAIQYVYKRYGELGAAMTANVITYHGKSAAREVVKALGFDADSLQRLSALVANLRVEGTEGYDGAFFPECRLRPETSTHCEVSRTLYADSGFTTPSRPALGRHGDLPGATQSCCSIRACIDASRTVVQWDKKDCADLGIIKVDLLGLGMMAVLKDCLELIPEHYGEPVDLAQLPEDDEVYRTLQRADTVGMFQVESRAQMASLPRNHPKKFYDVVVQVAIIRPGPIVGKMMHQYMRRRQKKEPVSYPHPSLESTLKRTLACRSFRSNYYEWQWWLLTSPARKRNSGAVQSECGARGNV